jgi:hypothetical protein
MNEWTESLLHSPSCKRRKTLERRIPIGTGPNFVDLNEQAILWKVCKASGLLSQSHGHTVHVVELDRVRGLEQWNGKNGSWRSRHG